MKMKSPNKHKLLRHDPKPQTVFVCTVLLLIGFIVCFAARWYTLVYGDTGFDSVMFTLTNGLNGAEDRLINSYLKEGLAPAVFFCAVAAFLIFFRSKRYIAVTFAGKVKFRLFPLSCRVKVIFACALSAVLVFSGAHSVRLGEYVIYQFKSTRIFDEKYVDPLSAGITFTEEKRNLIYIFVESLETAYMSEAQGGALKYDLIPELSELAENNINFSQNLGVGGYTAVPGTTWTAGAMVAHTAGIPLKVPFGFKENSYGADGFIPGAGTITEILRDNGYYQALMLGSDARFANRDYYYIQHGINKIYDYYTARDSGLIAKDYCVWWGMEDKYLYEYARQELTEIASKERPFAFTMLTADTHHVDGYVCSECGDKYEEQYENVISCADRQLASFISWIQEQDFYENTTIVVCGDHPTMDAGYISRNVDEDYDRHVYNCIINSAIEAENTKNREFSAFDMFPTTLAAMGCTIEGDRLGLGTNLFSELPTLIEEMGRKSFVEQMTRSSKYYNINFMQ